MWPISPPIAYRFGWNFHSVVSVVHVTGTVGVSHHMSHHTSQMSQTTEINPGPLVWHHFGNVTTPASTWDWNTCHRACNVLHHTSHVTHHMSQITRNRLGPLVWHHFGNVTTPALTWDWNTCHRACHVSHHTSCHVLFSLSLVTVRGQLGGKGKGRCYLHRRWLETGAGGGQTITSQLARSPGSWTGSTENKRWEGKGKGDVSSTEDC